MVLFYYSPPANQAAGVYDTRNFLGNAAGTHLFLNERDSDVSIRVEWDGDGWHLPAHRLVLSSMSEVFRRMFDTDMSEKNHGTVTITDSSPLTVKQFLKYLYMGTLDFNGWQEAEELMKMAHKYGVQALVTLCETYLVTTVTFYNACHLYEVAQIYSLDNLGRNTCNFILETAFIVTATDGFLNLSPKSLEFFLRSKHLNMENECCVLSVLKEWATVQCSRRGLPLIRENILKEMEPFMNFINWDLIPVQFRTFVPTGMEVTYMDNAVRRRKPFHVTSPVQYHANVLKFIVELGAYYEDKSWDAFGLCCLKFGVDNHAYVAGFRIVGMFKKDSLLQTDQSALTLGRDGNKPCSIFNLNSLPWTKGSTVGDHVWQELIAYLPFPVRVDPFGTYVINLKYSQRPAPCSVKWPYTRLESGVMCSSVGTINFRCCSECYGITQLLMLPAPPPRAICNIDP